MNAKIAEQQQQPHVTLDVADIRDQPRHAPRAKVEFDEAQQALWDMAAVLEEKGARESANYIRKGVLPPKTLGERMQRIAAHEVTVGNMLVVAIAMLGTWGIIELGLWAFDKPGLLIRKGGDGSNVLESAGAKRRMAA